MPQIPNPRAIWPGLALCVVVAMGAWLGEQLEIVVFGQKWIDGLVLAIVLGTIIHTTCGLAPQLRAGVKFAAKFVLELAIVLLGGTISGAMLLDAGLPLLAGIVAVVVIALGTSYFIGRSVGLTPRLAALVACGNSICGNSAIMAAAPVIAAQHEDVAASVGFTAVLGMAVILLLPSSMQLLDLSAGQYGVVAGLSVYAVPQVLAATAHAGPLSSQIGTLVKLVRVLMLGPVVLVLGLIAGGTRRAKFSPALLVPWFIVGFIVLMMARNVGLIPQSVSPIMSEGSTYLTLIAMAGLGLSVDLRSVLASGGRVLLAGTLSIATLVGLALSTALLLPPI